MSLATKDMRSKTPLSSEVIAVNSTKETRRVSGSNQPSLQLPTPSAHRSRSHPHGIRDGWQRSIGNAALVYSKEAAG